MKKLLFLTLACHVSAFCALPLATLPLQSASDSPMVSLGQLSGIDPMLLPKAKTEAWLGRTDQHLIVKVVCQEPLMNKLQAKLIGHDALVWTEDCVEIFIQPDSWKTYAHFSFNPLGTQYDELEKDSRWNLKCDVNATRGEDSWTIVVKIPFQGLGGQPKPNAAWKFNICRSRKPSPELSCWSPTQTGFHEPEKFGSILFANHPFPTEINWSFPAKQTGIANLKWNVNANQLELLLNGKPYKNNTTFPVDPIAATQNVLEAKSGNTTILRAIRTTEASPLATVIAEINELLKDAKHDDARETIDECRQFLKVLDMIPNENHDALKNNANQLLGKARQLKIHAEFAQNNSKDKITYGIESSLQKLLLHKPFTGKVGGTIKLDAGRNEMDAAQVALFAKDSILLATEAKLVGKLTSGNDVLDPSVLRIRRVGHVMTTKPTYKVEHVGLWPDALIEATPFDIMPNSFETLWIDVRVPTDAKPGIYKGTIQVAAMNSDVTDIPLEIRVRNFTIPQKSSIITAFGMNPRWRIPQNRADYLKNFLEHRITPYTCVNPPTLVSPALMDWKDVSQLTIKVQSPTQAPLDLSFAFTQKGNLATQALQVKPNQLNTFVISKQQLPNEPFESMKITVTNTSKATVTTILHRQGKQPIEIFNEDTRYATMSGKWLSAWPTWTLEAWEMPDIQPKFDWEEFDREFQKALDLGITSHIAQLKSPLGLWSSEFQKHLGPKGWLQYFYTYLYDEPEPSAFGIVNEKLSAVKRARPGKLKNMMTARSFPPELPFVDIWCPELYSYKPELSGLEQQKDREVWWYVAFSTRHPYPNIWTDYPALDCRVWPWMSWKHDIDGMLYWSVTHWNIDPWRSSATFPGANGDGSAIYPGNDGKPVDSIRWECLRDGMEDYELFCMLEAAIPELKAKNSKLLKQVEKLLEVDPNVLVSFKDYNPDFNALLKARSDLSDCLEQVVNELGHEPVIKNRPRRRQGVSPEEVDKALKEMILPKDASDAPVAAFATPNPKPEPGLRVHYTFDDDLPFFFDHAGNNLTAFNANATIVPGKSGNGIQTGHGKYVILPQGNDILGSKPTEGTVEFWVKPHAFPERNKNNTPAYACLFYLMETDGNGLPDGFDEIAIYYINEAMSVRCGGNKVWVGSTQNPLKLNQWHHIALTWKPNSRILYVDGKPVIAKNDDYDPPKLDAFKGTLGVHSPSRRFPFHGTFDNLKIWNRARTQEEIEQTAK
jgi:hypothetical protein